MERPEGETQPRAIPFLNIGGDDGDGDGDGDVDRKLVRGEGQDMKLDRFQF